MNKDHRMQPPVYHTAERFRLENSHLSAEFDAKTGALVSLIHKATGWTIQGRETLAASFRLVVPLPDRLLNVVDGVKQSVTSARENSENGRLMFSWEGVESENGGALDVRLEATVTLNETGLTFEMSIDNHCPYPVESVAYPFLGDLTRPTGSQTLRRVHLNYCNLHIKSLFPRFDNERGYWGVEYPIQMVPTPESPFLLVLAENEGLYIGCHDTEAAERVEYTFQLIPGYGKVGVVPSESEIAGVPVRQEFAPVHFPFVQPGETFRLSPIVLHPFTGDWHTGVDLYKAWRQTWMQRPAAPAWLQDIHSWQQLQMTSWGDSLRIPYRDLVQYGEECVQHGVSVIQLTGWTLYGQDGRLPIHDIDPRLGTWDELKAAVARCQELGVKIILYEKYTCTDVGTDWYKNGGYRGASRDIFGNVHGHEGWQYDMPSHLAGINTRPYAWMCMNSTEWQQEALAQVRHSLELDPDGLLLDECQWHGRNAFYCFDESHGHRIPGYNFGGDAYFERELRAILDRKNPELVLAGEGCYDLQYRHYTMAYHRTSANHLPGMRYIDPFLPLMNWAYGYDDREAINICLLYRYIISYEPRNFRGHLDEFPLTLEYGKKVDTLRRRYREFLWNAEFRDTVGATVTVNDQSHPLYSVFQTGTGDKAVVIANHTEATQQVIVVTPEATGQQTIVTPEEPEARLLDGAVALPPRSAVVVFCTQER
jgi:hypothetical protein